MTSSLKGFRTFNFVKDIDLIMLREKLNESGYFVFEINGEEIEDAESFFAKIKDVLPQDPPLSGQVNWDAFLDSIWSGLDKLKEEKVAIIWTNFHKMLDHGLSDLVTAIECFKDLAFNVSNPETKISIPVNLLFFFVGKGKNFKTLQ